jgi:putative MATE family efflux protein
MDDGETIGNVITDGSIWRAIRILALPSVVGFLIEDIFNFTDMYFVGFLGPEAISAVSIGGIITNFLINGAGGLAVGTLALVSRFVGEGKPERADFVATQSIVFGIVLSIAIGIPCALLARRMMAGFDVTAAVADYGTQYLTVIFLGCTSVLLTSFMSAALRGAGDAITPMVALAVGAIANVFLDPIMIFGLFGCPRMGVAGSAVATVLTRIIAIIIMLYALMGHRTVLKLRRRDMRPDGETIWRITRVGALAALSGIITQTSVVMMMGFVATYETAVEAAYGIGIRMNSLVTIPAQGLGYAGGAIVGQNLGAKKPERAEKAGWIITGLGVAIALPVVLVYYVFPAEMIGMFTADAHTINAGIPLMRVRASSLVYLAMSNCLAQTVSGSGDSLHPMLFTTFSLIVLRLCLIYPLMGAYEEIGIWIDLSLTNFSTGLLNAWWFVIGRWKRTEV